MTKDEEISNLKDEVERLEKDIKRLALSWTGSEGVISAVIDSIKGTVEGGPTSRLNFLQRVRELVTAESSLSRYRGWLERLLEAEDDWWKAKHQTTMTYLMVVHEKANQIRKEMEESNVNAK